VQGTIPSEEQSKAYFVFDRELSARYQGKITEWEASGSAGIKPTRLSVAKEIDLEIRRSDEEKELQRALANLERRFIGEEATEVQINIEITENTTIEEIEDALIAAGHSGNKLADYVNKARGQLVAVKRAKERRDALLR